MSCLRCSAGKTLLVGVCASCLLLLASLAARAKYCGPDVRVLAKVSNVIVLGRVEKAVPTGKPALKFGQIYSHVTVTVVETLKGRASTKHLVIGTKHKDEEGDYWVYHPGHEYLLFLVQKGDIYQPAFGHSGIFEKVGGKITGWVKFGEPTFPKPETQVEYQQVKKDIAKMLKPQPTVPAGHEAKPVPHQPAKGTAKPHSSSPNPGKAK